MGTAFIAAAALALSPPALVARAVAANEALYGDIDVCYRLEYRLADRRRGGEIRTPGGEAFARLILKQDATTRVVRRGDLYRVLTTTSTDAGDTPTTRVTGEAFDGKQTRARYGDHTEAQAGLGRVPQEVYFPHLWASAPWFEKFPLSAFLAGGETWDKHPGRDSAYEGMTVVRNLLTPGVVGDEPCVVVRCAIARAGVLTGVSYYWLAPGKNYLPVRVESYLRYYSATMPVQVVTAGDFRELRPGVWIPSRITKVVNQELELRDNERMVVSNTTITTVTRAILAPNHDRAFFRDLRVDGE
jgi:hypothetical protein